MDPTRLLRPAALLLALLLAGCRTAYNYRDPEGPRYVRRSPVERVAESPTGDTLRFVSFNIEFSERIDSAIALLTADPALRGADVILLQEMDAEGMQRIADALAMEYVFYPASLSLATHRDFGTGVLSRWPIVVDAKVVLPHIAPIGRTARIATAATIRVGDDSVRVYSVHLATLVNAWPGAREDQLRTVLADAARYPRVVIGGDLNSHGIGERARELGYLWPTEEGPRTHFWGRFDHIFLKGLASPGRLGAGTVLDVHDASDHRPVWAVGILH